MKQDKRENLLLLDTVYTSLMFLDDFQYLWIISVEVFNFTEERDKNFYWLSRQFSLDLCKREGKCGTKV